MLKRIVLIFILCGLLPLFSFAQSNQDYRTQFINTIMTNGQKVDNQIANDRQAVINLKNEYEYEGLSSSEKNWLVSLASQYGLKNPNFNDNRTWEALESRVDVIPLSLIISQAIYESNWGKSRFAQLGNNFFGQRCYNEGCGIVPNQRGENQKFEVKSFPTIYASIKSYVHNLNVHRTYQYLRQLRSGMRDDGDQLDGVTLAKGLSNYSQQAIYVSSIQTLIQRYNLKQFDA